MTKAVQGEEYKVLKQKPLVKKIANVFIFFWFILIMCPSFYILFKNADSIKEYAVVRSVYETNDVLQSQYKNITDNLLSKVDISKYTSKIEIPEIKLDKVSDKLDKVSDKTKQVNQVSSQLAKLGEKDSGKGSPLEQIKIFKNNDVAEKVTGTAAKVADSSAKVTDATAQLQQQVDKINEQIQTNVQKVKTTLETDIQASLKNEISTFADTQVQKQLNLSQKAYTLLTQNKFGLMTEAVRMNTKVIYQELEKTKLSFIRNVIKAINQYYKWLVLSFAALLLIALLIPPVIVWWLAKKFCSAFTECPYCHKIFLTKANKFGLFKIFKK